MAITPPPLNRYSQRVVAHRDADEAPIDDSELRRASLYGDLRWLVRMRWLAVAALAVCVAIAQSMQMIDSADQVACVVLALALENLVWQQLLRREPQVWPEWMLVRLIFAQLLLDMIVLALLIHLTGGIENPFEKFLVFHVALGAILLPRRLAWSLLVIGGLVHSVWVFGPPLGLWGLHPLLLDGADAPTHGIAGEGRHVALYLAAHWLAAIGVVYFVRTVRVRQQRAEVMHSETQRLSRQHERLARVGALSAGVAHAIRNPVHGALNCLDILAGQPEPSATERGELVDLMQEALQRIERVTRRLLMLNRATGPTRMPASLSDLLSQVVRLANAKARTQDVTVVLTASQLPQAEIDADQLSEALLNLIDNAVDETHPGGTVHVRAEWGQSPSEPVRVQIEDGGAGIAANILPRLFEPFFTTKPIGRGTGIGLAIAKRAVHDHGGEIEILSDPGVGTCVQISLPLGVEPPSA
jgi:two-component system sensor histidine kinase RegB